MTITRGTLDLIYSPLTQDLAVHAPSLAPAMLPLGHGTLL